MRSNRKNGFTLIELILVMAVLATVLALAAPTLSGFVKGRSLQEEARRFLALTRYGRSQAISCSAGMELWLHPESGTYGLKPFSGGAIEGDKPVAWTLGEDLSFEVVPEAINKDGRAAIVFWPDGSIDPDSLDRLTIQEARREAIEIRQMAYGLGYEIPDEEGGNP